MTATLQTTNSAAREVSADAIVIAVGQNAGGQGTGGLVLAPGAQDIDAALGGGLAETLSALGATGKPEEVTRIVSAGKLAAPVIAAVGIGTATAAEPGSTPQKMPSVQIAPWWLTWSLAVPR